MSAVESHLYRPPSPLSAYVECMWYRRGSIPGRRRELSMPTGKVDLVINLRADRIRVFESPGGEEGIVCRGAIVHGAQSSAFVLDDLRHVHFVGVHFKPGGAVLLGLPSSEIADRHVSLEDLWGARAAELRERLMECATASECFAVLERELIQRLSSRVLVHPVVSSVLRRALSEPRSVADLQRESGYSERQFTRVFAHTVGLTPKKYLRVLRLEKVLRQLASSRSTLAEVAAEHGYFDQAHFFRDFRSLTGVAPSQYKPMARSPWHMEL